MEGGFLKQNLGQDTLSKGAADFVGLILAKGREGSQISFDMFIADSI